MTFSIIARDADNGAFGVAVSTAVPCVGAIVPHLRRGVGAIATQSFANVKLGTDGLPLLERGLSPEAALTALLQEDEEAPKRQVAGIDSRGRVFAYSGDECIDWYGHRTGENYSVQGNMLVGEETIGAMAETFVASEGNLAKRLMESLEAGQSAGGDKRGRESAALVVVPAEEVDPWFQVNIRVDQHEDPVAELRRIFDLLIGRYREALAEAEQMQKPE